jgi:hypothetical protein
LCAKQNIAFRGHDESEDSSNPGNFRAIVDFLSHHDQDLKKCMETLPACINYKSPEIQNELIDLLGNMVREWIRSEVQESGVFCLLCDESRDVSKDEQLAVVLWYVLHGKVYERFLSMTPLKNLSSEGIADDICQVLTRNYISLLDCVSQTYDGVSVMSSKHQGVQKRIRDISPKSLYVHC